MIQLLLHLISLGTSRQRLKTEKTAPKNLMQSLLRPNSSSRSASSFGTPRLMMKEEKISKQPCQVMMMMQTLMML
jgi:hypothetical protein